MALDFAHDCTRRWFETSFDGPTAAQQKGWPAIAGGESTLLLAPTGSGKTLAAFLVAIDRLLFAERSAEEKVRVLYVSPLKALAVDVERNLRAPLAGIKAAAEREGSAHHPVSVGVRTGDTPSTDRQRMKRHPPDILITTPESLFLMMTSQAARILTEVETVILDEIHSLVPTKRGSHTALTLERLEAIRNPELPPLQRIGLSATQRPLEEVAAYLGGATAAGPRPVRIVDAGSTKAFDLTVEVPVEDMARLDVEPVADEDDDETPPWERVQPGPASADTQPSGPSIWPAIHPRLVKLIREHRSTMIFVNSRRLAERLSGAINELAGEELALAHHGSVAKDIRANIEDRLKRGQLPAIVATSSLELGIDIGFVDLVIQIEAPPSVASGIQRIGRAGHQVGAVSEGVIFPKYRHDLLACASVVRHVRAGHVESTRYPRNALDVLAQQVVAIVAQREAIGAEDLYTLVRGAAPYRELPRRAFEGVLDMLSGRYPSEQFGELRPRITWDRIQGTLTPRRGAKMLAIANAGTIPDRGLYGVFLADSERSVRVGELDEEMVFESREGEVFLLGATSWRIEEITHERVLVSPAPGEPGKMPFWHGDRPGRPAEFGRAIGALTRELSEADPEVAQATLVADHGLDEKAAANLVRYLADQKEATRTLPTDRRIVIERFIDEIGDPVVTIHSPFGARVHAPWATAVQALLMEERGLEVDLLYSDDGIVFRFPEVDEPPDDALFFPSADEVERLITGRVGETALFAARFRENAGRALLLPRRRPGQRTPLWQQRRKSASLLGVASGFRDFPVILETYRECLQDVFDLPALQEILHSIETRKVRLSSVQTKTPSPFAAALLFDYVASFLYEGDAPLAERRAQALSLDPAMLRELLGEPELRELLDADAVREVEVQLQRRKYPIDHPDRLHDLLLTLGDLSEADLMERSADGPEAMAAMLDQLAKDRRISRQTIGGEARVFAIEDVARYRDALGIVPPRGTPQVLLQPVADPLGDLVARFARSNVPFRAETFARRYGLGVAPVRAALTRLEATGRLVEGELLPRALLRERGLGAGREWCDAEVLRRIKRASLAKLRQQVEPVEPEAYARFLCDWQQVTRPRRGADAVMAVVEQLQGAAIPYSDLESRVFPARVEGFDRRDLDELFASGEVRWRGMQSLGDKDGRIALYLAEHYALLAPDTEPAEGALAAEIRGLLGERGALFFRDLVAATGRLPGEVFEALYDLVWAGEVTNDTLTPLRSLGTPRRGRMRRGLARRAAPTGPPGSEGRWSLLPTERASATERLEAHATQLLERTGVLMREAIKAEPIRGGFSAIYPVLKAMEDVGRVRRGYFVAGRGATQFSVPGAEDRLRDHRDPPEEHDAVVLAADDPANPYGVSLPWPDSGDGLRPARSAGSQVVLYQGHLVGYIGRTGERLSTFLPVAEPERSRAARAMAEAVGNGTGRPRGKRGGGGVLLARIDGAPAHEAPYAPYLEEAGFRPAAKGLFRRFE
ncbi:MAG: DEAD/DEAH box helicase [Deltaproteobacteria bacterium]|nr:DEAD/DEAH box helicase [Deltaproteobacteria bacterium]